MSGTGVFTASALILAVAAAGLLSSCQGKIDPLYDRQYVAVYGVNNCSLTEDYLDTLRKKGIRYTYKDINDANVRDKELFPRMRKARVDIGAINGPVIDVNGNIFIQPDPEKILKFYVKNPPRKNEAPGNDQAGATKVSLSKEGSFEVTGIMMSDEPCAIINGEIVKTGDKVFNCEVIEIQGDLVKFRTDGGKVITKTIK